MLRPFNLASILIAITFAAASCSSQKREPDAARIDPSAFAVDENFFPITAWEIPFRKHDLMQTPGIGVDSMKECNFTVAAFVTADQLPMCEKLGMRAIVGPRGDSIRNWRTLSDEQIVAKVKALVEPSKHSPAVIGYFLMDEPGVRDFPAMGKAVAAVKELAPGKLAYINLLPNYATIGAPNLSQLGTKDYEEYLERYVAEVRPQFISWDNYQVLMSNELQDAKRADSYFNNLLQVRRIALSHSIPFWQIVSSNQIRPHTPVPSPANFALQAYTTLASGARGLTWFTYYVSRYHYAPIDDQNHRTATWSYLKSVNEQVKTLGPIMNRLKNTGLYFTDAPATTRPSSRPTLPGKVIQSIDSATALMIGEFEDGSGTPYAMIVNLSLEKSSKITIHAQSAANEMTIISPTDGSRSTTQPSNGLWLPAGQGALIQFNSAKDTK